MKLSIPLRAAAHDREGTRPAPSGSPHAEEGLRRSPLRVLVVDDERDAALMLMALLREEGHDVRAAYGGASALVVARYFRPHAMFVDIRLPDLSGWEVARQVLVDHAGAGTLPLLVAVTGVYIKTADQLLSRSVGFRHFITKPYDPDALLELLAPLRSPED